MSTRAFDWRLPVTWSVLFAVSIAARTYVGVSDEARRGQIIGYDRVLVDEITSHLVVAALLPALYWLHRRWPLGNGRNLAIHVAAVVPFSILHTSGMAALRLLWLSAIVGVPYRFPLTFDRLQYEFAKDLVTYLMLTTGVLALNYLLQRKPDPVAERPPPAAPPERFAVRKRGGSEVMVEVTDIDWIEASGNYAILHVGGDTEILVYPKGTDHSPASFTILNFPVTDIEAACAELAGRGVEVGPIRHFERGEWLEGKGGPWNSFANFADPDGNGWILQETPNR